MSTNDPYTTPESDPPPTYETATSYPTTELVVRKERPWLVPVLVTAVAFLTVGFLVVAGYFLLTESNPLIDNVDPQPNLTSEEMSGYEQAESLMDITWNKMTYEEQQDICDAWNLGLEDIFLDAFMEGAGDSASQMGITDSELRAVVTTHIEEVC
jgi:hypothetical protein